MTTSIKISDFQFQFAGYGHYKVTYQSPRTGKRFTTTTSDMPLIDATKNEDRPKIKDLNQLKATCKRA
jgi:nucleoid DNA-binding protein